MFLEDYFHNINNNYKNFFFSGISFDSNQIKKNYIFFAIRGNSVDGNNFTYLRLLKKAQKLLFQKKK